MIRLLPLLLFTVTSAFGQDYSPFTNTIKKLYQAAQLTDTTKLHQLWNELQQKKSIPLIHEDSVAFLYHGQANSVVWMGDFNGWGYDRKFNNKGTRIGNSNIWILKASFPKNARLDYKITLNGHIMILDPENHHQQWSGLGGGSLNSELRMPLWKEDHVLLARPEVLKGTIKSDLLYLSKVLKYQLTYNVYLPVGYSSEKKYPVLYVTDGYEYMSTRLGNMVTILDNLIHDKKIIPLIVVFVDNREPINRSNNKRMQELAMNQQYLEFFIKELIPLIEKNYAVAAEASQRGIMGNSMGGLTATYFAFERPDVFGLAGIQSPAFWTKPQIYALCSSSAKPEMKISMTSGLIHDTSEESRKMKAILESSACEHHYREVNQGHSWGNWRGLIDDVLIDLFGVK